MVSINYAFRELSCKIVFYGPGLSGKTTNLQYVHKKIAARSKGELISLATDGDRTLYFDFLPLNIGEIHGFATKFQLYTVPGQVYYNATRKLVLRGVDGLVFVADSQKSMMKENQESLNNLAQNLAEYGYEIDHLPLIFQYNKRDLPEIASLPELETLLNPKGLPHIEAVAIRGEGVFDTLKCITKLVLDKAKGVEKIERKEEVPIAQVKEKEMHLPSEEKTEIPSKPLIVVPEPVGVEMAAQASYKKDVSRRPVAQSSESAFARTPSPLSVNGKKIESKKEKALFEHKKEEMVKPKEITRPYSEKRKRIMRAPEPREFFLWRWIKSLIKPR
jgi:signal recognition particle receptor subunit beta